MKISKQGIDIIKSFEGFSSKPYLDVAGIPTIGYGITVYPDGRMVQLYDPPITEDQAEEYLLDAVQDAENAVASAVEVPLEQHEFDALVSFVYNVGTYAFLRSTLLRKINAGDKHGAADEFLRWVNAGGKKINGLIRRREAERRLFLGDN